jgi:hypothetical protein
MIALVLIGILVFSQTGLASSFINAINPNSVGKNDPPAIVPPLLIPPDPGALSQQVQLLDEGIASPDGRPVAQLSNPSKEIAGLIYVDFPDIANIVEEELGFVVLASVKYSGDKGTIIISTSRPTLAMSPLAVALGDKEIKLSDGTTAWLRVHDSGDFPNSIVFVRDTLIITIAGDLPVGQILQLATQVTIK